MGAVPGDGRPRKRFDARFHLRRALESPSDELLPISFSPAEEFARKFVSTLREMEGRDYVGCAKSTYETAYGSLVVQEAGDHASGQAARDKVDHLLGEADRLRKLSRETRG